MVFEGITDRLRNRRLLNKEPTTSSDELDSGIPTETIDDLADYEPQPIPRTPDINPMEDMEPSSLGASQKSLKNITSPSIGDVMKDEPVISIDETLEPYNKSELSDLPTREEELLSPIPEPTVTPKMPEIPETPKMPETPKIEPIPETVITDKLSPEEKAGPSLTDAIKSKFKTATEYKKTLGENLRGGPPLTETDYAIRGEYKGLYSKDELNEMNKALSIRREALLASISDIDKDIIDKRQEAKDTTDKLKTTTDIATRAQANSELKRINDEIKRLEDKREIHVRNVNKYEQDILDNRRRINEYDIAVRKGRMKASTSARIGKKLQALGEGAEIVSSGVYGGKSFGRGDWFGPKGFLSQPYKQSNITSNVVQPVKARLSNLDAITRSTGAIVGHGMVDAVTTVRANKNITPFGVPGTIQGAHKQFDYNIPAKKILPGDVTTNINRDILPSIFSPIRKPAPVTLSPMEYQQVVQPDGSIVNVPVQQQQRKHKQFSISVNRFTRNASMARGPKITVKPVGSRLERGINSVGTLKPMDIDIGGKKNFTLGLITAKDMNINGTIKPHAEIESKKEYRKSKKKEPLVNLDSAMVINKNINKLLSKKKK